MIRIVANVSKKVPIRRKHLPPEIALKTAYLAGGVVTWSWTGCADV